MMTVLSRTTRKRALSIAKESAPTSHNAAETTTTRTKVSVSAVASPSISKDKAAPKTKLAAPAHVKSTPWVSIKIPRSELDLSTTLKGGQSFRWLREHRELETGQISLPSWSCVLDHRLWRIQETEDGFQYRTFKPSSTPMFTASSSTGEDKLWEEQQKEEDRDFLRDYFQLHVPLTDFYAKWSKSDANFRAKAPLFPGVRILRQDPVENLICFICSSNNNIGRISQMATKLCQEYGSPITIPAEEPGESPRTFYGFPTMDALAQEGTEETLRRLGFGYRAKYIANTAKMINAMDSGEEWLMGLRSLPYEEAHNALLTLQGVGPKVADCVCLMSLDKQNSIPVDTHVWQIAVRDYKFQFGGKVPKAISPAIYKAVGKHFVDLFGDYSGWAHSVLFAADLRTIEGRVKEEPGAGLVKVKEEAIEPTGLSTVAIDDELTVKKEDEGEQESRSVRRGVKAMKLEDVSDTTSTEPTPAPTPAAIVASSRRQSKRRKGT
ncbi:N-glycosylase/DNA lyase [Dissophora ornata]|nr:N-glycosylase/DNA lyase [Dissophora ornata]